jgi:hypothetical protein
MAKKKKRQTAEQKKRVKARQVKSDLALLARIKRRFPLSPGSLFGFFVDNTHTDLLARIENAINHEREMRRKAEQRVAVLEALTRRALLVVERPTTTAAADAAIRYVVDGQVPCSDDDDE